MLFGVGGVVDVSGVGVVAGVGSAVYGLRSLWVWGRLRSVVCANVVLANVVQGSVCVVLSLCV